MHDAWHDELPVRGPGLSRPFCPRTSELMSGLSDELQTVNFRL
jgi:hypothetical protein